MLIPVYTARGDFVPMVREEGGNTGSGSELGSDDDDEDDGVDEDDDDDNEEAAEEKGGDD